MSDTTFDRETLLDLSVNIVPLAIILFFAVLLVVFDPFGSDIVAMGLAQLLHVVPFVVLAVVTYVSGRIIAEAEHTGGSETAARIAERITGEVATDDE
ncbi:DUF6684 family protein [Halococcus sp. AFM35]|uniref:DUF6684 family protein n=1 Tax=Halococcus sp. AFM35 TaxID=3421653 RepID=UPI003EBDEBDF